MQTDIKIISPKCWQMFVKICQTLPIFYRKSANFVRIWQNLDQMLADFLPNFAKLIPSNFDKVRQIRLNSLIHTRKNLREFILSAYIPFMQNSRLCVGESTRTTRRLTQSTRTKSNHRANARTLPNPPAP